MPRPKEYADDATRAAAWRLRQQQEQVKAAGIANQAERLHQVVKQAAARGDSEAAALAGATTAETLRNLQQHFQRTATS